MKHSPRIYFLFSFIFVWNLGFSQNLVPNWSFEQYSQCPYAFTQIEFADGWFASYVDNCCTYQVEYLNACGTAGFQVPDNVWGYQQASTGVAYMAQVTMDLFVQPNYRENIYAKLLSPLVIGETYYCSMKVAQTNVSQYSSNNDGIKFSTDTTMAVDNIAAIHSANIITDSVNWTTIEGCFRADSAYTYIGVGNFFDDAHTNSIQSCPTCLYHHWGYYVDDISVLPMSISGGDTICSGGTSILRATGGTTYLWSNGATVDSIIVNPTSTTSYSVQIINPSCTIDTSCTVYVESGSGNATISGSSAVCSGSPDTLKASGGSSYTWSNGATTSNVIVNPTTTTTYSVKIAGGCGNTDTSITVTVNPAPTLVVSPNDTICSGNSVALSVSGATTYSWTPNTGLSCNSCANPTASPSVTTNYVVTGSDADGCSDTKNVTVFVSTAPILAAIPVENICWGNQITLVASETSGSYGSFTWMPGGSTAASITVSPTITTTYTVEYSNLCGETTTTVTVYVSPGPIPSFSADVVQGCAPLCIQFRNLSTLTNGTISAWSWQFGNGDTSNKENPIYCYPTPGNYTPVLTVTSNSGCSATLKILHLITVYSKPNAAFTYSPQTITILEPTVQFTDKSTDVYGIAYWFWNFGDTPQPPTGGEGQNPVHTYTDTGTYCAQLAVMNVHGCVDTVTNCLIIDPVFTLYIPSAFSPNGDSKNDFFAAKGEGIKSFEMYVFDRWGMELFHSTNINVGWNGTVNGGNTICQQDTYVYMIKVTDWRKYEHNYTGQFSLIK